MISEWLDYNPESGVFVWKKGKRKGLVAGCDSNGYVVIKVDGKNYLAHRLAFFLVNGRMPAQVDHVDGNKKNNSIANLRECTVSQNMQNLRAARKSSSTGYLGVTPVRYRGKYLYYRASICVDKKARHIGLFKTPELAHEAYLKAKREIHEFSTL